jgi:hypothetical protein
VAPIFYGLRPVNPPISSETLCAPGLCFRAGQMERLEKGIRIAEKFACRWRIESVNSVLRFSDFIMAGRAFRHSARG